MILQRGLMDYFLIFFFKQKQISGLFKGNRQLEISFWLAVLVIRKCPNAFKTIQEVHMDLRRILEH